MCYNHLELFSGDEFRSPRRRNQNQTENAEAVEDLRVRLADTEVRLQRARAREAELSRRLEEMKRFVSVMEILESYLKRRFLEQRDLVERLLSPPFLNHCDLCEEVGHDHFGYTCSATAKKGSFKGQDVVVKAIAKSKGFSMPVQFNSTSYDTHALAGKRGMDVSSSAAPSSVELSANRPVKHGLTKAATTSASEKAVELAIASAGKASDHDGGGSSSSMSANMLFQSHFPNHSGLEVLI
ncbi:hypothetical protein RJ641_011577 [Dillenia turbinata]|uniref:Uncharacterized protein n=1 Tax=Dillenia turbinata TaxID=194707 RepID=A0AAN8UU86_9MAGN